MSVLMTMNVLQSINLMSTKTNLAKGLLPNNWLAVTSLLKANTMLY